MTKGKAAKSASGAAKSKYDVEVEARLQALESKSHSKCGSGIGVDAAKLEEMWNWYQNAKRKV